MDTLSPEEIKTILEGADSRISLKGSRHKIVGYMIDIAILHAHINPSFENAQYTASIKNKEGVWRHSSQYYPCPDTAMLGAIGFKHDPSSSQFGFFAARMLQLA